MIKYSPFERGKFPVGVRTEDWTCADGQQFATEIWYPADEQYRGQDLDAATCDHYEQPSMEDGTPLTKVRQAVRDAKERDDKFPLVMLMHGWGGFRRESYYMGAHLASHGYIVVSVDFPVSNEDYVNAFFMEQQKNGASEEALQAHINAIAGEREKYVPLLIDQAMERIKNIDGECVGMTGASYGGWTSYMAPHVDKRVTAIAPMCPASHSDFRNESGAIYIRPIDSTASQEVLCLAISGDRDNMVVLPAVLETFQKIKYHKKLAIVARADHNHFVDDVEEWQAVMKDEFLQSAALYPNSPANWEAGAARVTRGEDLLPGKKSNRASAGLACIVMDAGIKKIKEARELFDGDLEGACDEIGVSIYTVS